MVFKSRACSTKRSHLSTPPLRPTALMAAIMQPPQVLTTYDALRQDLGLQPDTDAQERSLRCNTARGWPHVGGGILPWARCVAVYIRAYFRQGVLLPGHACAPCWLGVAPTAPRCGAPHERAASPDGSRTFRCTGTLDARCMKCHLPSCALHAAAQAAQAVCCRANAAHAPALVAGGVG